VTALSRLARRPTLVSLLLVAGGCAHGEASYDPDRIAKLPVPPARTVCGWEQLEADADAVTVGPDGSATPAAVGQTVVILRPHRDAPFAAVGRALSPAAGSLVRLKVVVDDRWLVPVTFPRPVHPHPIDPKKSWVSSVGRRKVTRSTEAPGIRFAEIRLDGDRALVHVENEAPGGWDLPIAELAAKLRATEPAVGFFALTGSAETPWKHVQAAAVAAACYDRAPGEEPHDVLLDTGPRPR
jgi:hypothetical protein